MYGEIKKIEELPEGIKVIRTSEVTHYYSVRMQGEVYYIPILRGTTTVLKKLGIRKLEKLTQDIINGVRIQVQEHVACGIHTLLRQQINDGFEKMYGDNLFNMITGKIDENSKLLNENSESEKDIECLVLKRKIESKGGLMIDQYMIANGGSMGRWTIHFGVHCLADTSDCKGYVKRMKETLPESEIVNYKVTKI